MTETTTQEYAIRERSTGRRIEVETLDDALAECSRRGRGWYLDAPPSRAELRGHRPYQRSWLPPSTDTRGLVMARTRAKLTRQAVAALMGVHADTVRKWETTGIPAFRRAELMVLYGGMLVDGTDRAKTRHSKA